MARLHKAAGTLTAGAGWRAGLLAAVWAVLLAALLATSDAAAQPLPASTPRFALLLDPGAPWLPASVFSPQDRAAAAAAPPLRVAVARGGVAGQVEVAAAGEVQGAQVQLLLAVARQLGLQFAPLVLADEAAVLQALQDGRADLALAVAVPPLNTAAPPPGLVYSLGTGAQPLAWLLLREARPMSLDQARIAHLGHADPAAADRLRRHHPGATLLPEGSALQALQAVLERRADAYVGNLLAALAVLQQTPLPGLELRQVWPGEAGHRHLALRAEHAALLPAFNKAIAAWRATKLPHQAVLAVAQRAAPQLRAPLALPADGAGADTAVMNGLLQATYALSGNAAQRLPLAERSSWRVGVLKNSSAPAGGIANNLSGLDSGGRHTGAAADMLQELALRLGLVLQLQPFDTEAAMLEALRAGQIDLLPLLQHTPQEAAGLQFTLPWLELPQVLVGAESGTLYWGLDTLRGRRLALATVHPLRAEVQRLHPGIQLLDAASGAEALALVRTGAADVAMDIKPVVQQQLGSAAGAGLRVLGDVPEFTARYRVAVPDSQRRLLPLLDAALADIDTSERQRSVRRWLVTEPVAQRPWWQHRSATALLAVAALALAGLAAWGWWPRLWVRRAVGQGQPADFDSAPEAQAFEPQTAPSTRGTVPLETLLQAVMAPHYKAAERAGQRLHWSVDEALPQRIAADPEKLSELLDLLLSRALALTAPQHGQGRLAFKARLGQLDNGHAALLLSVNVSAASPGPEATQDPRIVRAQDLALALGGDLVLRSREGVGHAVSVRVPLRVRPQNSDPASG